MMKNLRDVLRYVSPEENEGESTDQNTDNEDPTRKARRWPISRRYMEAALQDICEYNDISEEQLVSAPETIVSIEMFLYNFPHICCMSFFPNLVSLSLVQQNLLSIEGLHYCPHLELLRLSENSIQRIEGLGNCLKLKELFLHSNRINRITGVAHLTNLDVLWLSNNEIRTVDGLGDLRLKELSLARNPISQLGLHISITMSSQFERQFSPAPYCVFRFLLSTLGWEVIVLKSVVVLLLYHLHVQWLIQPQLTGNRQLDKVKKLERPPILRPTVGG